MNSDFADVEGTIRDPTRALIGKVVDTRSPLIRNTVRGIQLAFGEVFQTAIVETTEGNVDGMGSKHGVNGVSDDRRFDIQLGLVIVVSVVWLGLDGGDGLPRTVRIVVSGV